MRGAQDHTGRLVCFECAPASGAQHQRSPGFRPRKPEFRRREHKDRDRAILKNRETRLSSRRRPYGCQHLLAQYCSSRPDETLSWAASSRFRAARQARYVRSKGDQLHCPYCLATLSFPSTTHLASEGRPHREMRVLSALTKSRNWDTQYTAIAPSLKSGRRTRRMALATSRSSAGTGPVAACE